MRVVAGRLGSRTIASPPGRSRAVRPTSDRARETLFAILGDVSDLLVLDLFCGTGALAIIGGTAVSHVQRYRSIAAM